MPAGLASAAGLLSSATCRPLSLSCGFGTAGNPSYPRRIMIFQPARSVHIERPSRLARRGPPRYTFYSWRHDPATTILSVVDPSLGDYPFINCCARPQQGRLREPARGQLMAPSVTASAHTALP